MKNLILVVLAIALTLPATEVASGSSGFSETPSEADSEDSREVTETVVVTEIKPNGTILVKNKKTNETHPLVLNYKTKLTAQDKKAFNGRRELKASDLAVGHELKVVTRQVNGEVLRVKILKS